MSVFQLGPVLRNRREELGLSQEDLADGICAVPTLSRIENGERMPTKNHFEMLMQRLGYSAMSLDCFTDKRDFLVHELKFKIRQAYVVQNFSQARKYLDDLECLIEKKTKIDQQFLTLYQVLLNKTRYETDAKIKKLEDALKLTCPRYACGNIPHVLSYEEIILLNNIAISYNAKGDSNRTISIFYTLKEYYEHHVVSTDEALRTQPMILYNLSKVLGLSGRFDECIEICDLGIRIARTTGRCTALEGTMYNRAWALLKRNHYGDRESARSCLKQAYYFAMAMEKTKEAESLLRFYEDNFLDCI